MCVLMIVGQNVTAKSWRGIVPLKSTRADVERLLGKPAESGLYQFRDERATIHYSDGSCLRKDSCKCLVPKDTVLSVYVEPVHRSFSSLKIDKRKYTRGPIISGPPRFSYFNRVQGIIYTIDEADDEVIDIEYLQSTKDCQNIIKRNAAEHGNSWRD